MLITNDRGTETISLNAFTNELNQELFINNIRLLNTVTQLNLINKICSDIKSPFRANTDIVFKAMDAILKDNSFNETELLEYFDSKRELEAFENFTYKIIDYEMIYILYEVEFHLLGFSLLKYFDLSSNEQDFISNAYCELLGENILDSKIFIAKAKKIIAEFEKQ